MASLASDTVASLASDTMLIHTCFVLPEFVLLADSWAVGGDVFTQHWALSFVAVPRTPGNHRYAAAALLPAFQARISTLSSADFQSCKVNLCLVFAVSCFLEGILVSSVQAMVDPPILCFSCFFNALAGDPICLTAVLLLLLLAASQGGRAPGEVSWTGLVLPLILPAPVQLSATAGVSGADVWFVKANTIGVTNSSAPTSSPLPLFDAGAGVGRGTHVTSAAPSVSVFVLGMIIANTIAALSEWAGDAIGADGWRPLIAKVREIPLLVPAVLPLETAAGAFGAAAPSPVTVADDFAAASAILFGIPFCRCADVATSPILMPIVPLASIISLTVVREEEEEEDQQPAPPCSQH